MWQGTVIVHFIASTQLETSQCQFTTTPMASINTKGPKGALHPPCPFRSCTAAPTIRIRCLLTEESRVWEIPSEYNHLRHFQDSYAGPRWRGCLAHLPRPIYFMYIVSNSLMRWLTCSRRSSRGDRDGAPPDSGPPMDGGAHLECWHDDNSAPPSA